MLDYARDKAGGNIEWHEADACKLPFADGAFAAVVCAFGIMFNDQTLLRQLLDAARFGNFIAQALVVEARAI